MNPLADRPPPPFMTRTRYLGEPRYSRRQRQKNEGASAGLMGIYSDQSLIFLWLYPVNKYLSSPVHRERCSSLTYNKILDLAKLMIAVEALILRWEWAEIRTALTTMKVEASSAGTWNSNPVEASQGVLSLGGGYIWPLSTEICPRPRLTSANSP